MVTYNLTRHEEEKQEGILIKKEGRISNIIKCKHDPRQLEPC